MKSSDCLLPALVEHLVRTCRLRRSSSKRPVLPELAWALEKLGDSSVEFISMRAQFRCQSVETNFYYKQLVHAMRVDGQIVDLDGHRGERDILGAVVRARYPAVLPSQVQIRLLSPPARARLFSAPPSDPRRAAALLAAGQSFLAAQQARALDQATPGTSARRPRARL